MKKQNTRLDYVKLLSAWLIIPDAKVKNYCAFKAVRGKENFFVAVQDNPRNLPSGKIFESQNILIEQNGDISSFKRWVASVKPIKGRNKK